MIILHVYQEITGLGAYIVDISFKSEGYAYVKLFNKSIPQIRIGVVDYSRLTPERYKVVRKTS